MPASRRMRQLSHIGFAGAASMLLLLFALSWLSLAQQRHEEKWVRNSHDVISTGEHVLSLLKDAETGQRGYVLMQRREFLDPFIAAQSQIATELTALTTLTRDNPTQQERLVRLRSALPQFFGTLQWAVDHLTDAAVDTPALDAQMLKAKHEMDGFRAVMADFISSERNLCTQRIAEADLQYRRVTLWLVVSASMAILNLALAYGAVDRLLALRHAAERHLERRVSERTRELTAANAELETFSYSVSHDLRTPLRAIDGFVSLAERRINDGKLPEAAQHLVQVHAQAEVMDHLIRDILNFSQLSHKPLLRAAVHLRELAQETWAAQASDRVGLPHPVELEIAPDLPEVTADPALLRQVLANLIGNAVKYSAAKNPAKISFSWCRQPLPDFSQTPPGPPAADAPVVTVFSISDNGDGFDMRYYGKLFGVFKRLHTDERFHGTGIGLAIVRRIIERHGGLVWAEGRPGQGATFWFTLGP